MLFTVDVGKKRPCTQPKDGQLMWKKWIKLRREIWDRDNHAIKKAIARLLGSALPSGTDFSLFLNCLIYKLYVAKECAK